MSDSPVIEAEDLSKVFVKTVKGEGFAAAVKSLVKPNREQFEAVKSVSFSIKQGEFVGFLGPNGAGKTTTIKMLSGILYPSSGRASVLGYTPFDRNPEMLRQIALVMGNRQQLWWDLPAQESFAVLREIYGVDKTLYRKRLDHLVEALGLKDKLSSQVRKLSLGERMKCELVAALLHSPRILFLDEPTIGLDLMSQRAMREFLKEYNRTENATVLLTSHYMRDVEELCQRVMVINHGQLFFDGKLPELANRFGHTKQVKVRLNNEVPAQTLETIAGFKSIEGLEAVFVSTPAEVAALTTRLLAELPVSDIVIEDPDIDDVVEHAFKQETHR